MAPTHLSTNQSDIDRWAAEHDVVPVREGDGFALVHEGDVGLDQERLHWDEFHAERAEETVVLHREDADGASLAVVDRVDFLDRADLPEEERREVASRLLDGETVTLPASATGRASETDSATGGAESASEPTNQERDRRTDPEQRDVGKVAVVATGDEVGKVTAVEDETVYVDPHPGLTESALATLGWTSADDEDVAVAADRIERITMDAVRLTGDVDAEAFEETTASR